MPDPTRANPPSHDPAKPGPIPDHGVPDQACDAEPTGLPTSDRHHTETTPADRGGSAETPKHDHKHVPRHPTVK